MLCIFGSERSRRWLLAALFFASQASAQQSPTSGWIPGQYRGLVTGSSTIEDVIRVLGKPAWQGPPIEVPSDPSELQYHYGSSSTADARFDVFFKSGVVQEVTLNLGSIDQSKAHELFGPGLVTVRFCAKNDGSNTGSALLCEDPNGDSVLLLNPQKGLSLWVDPDGSVTNATYSVARPGRQHCSAKDSKPAK